MPRRRNPSARTRPARSRGGRGPLWILVLMLLASGGLRLMSGTGQVIAEEMAGLAGGNETADASAEPEACDVPEDIAAVLEALDLREARIETREAALADRAAALKLAEEEIARNLAALQAAEQELEAMVALSEEASESDLARLTTVYESMKPKEAAALFETMAPDFAAGFLGRMRPDAAAAIMAGLTPETAYTVSVLLAGRNANAPTE
ncbi:MAG: hypothetical protein CMH12_00845 [Maritimibacter sp.]|nr:hypothetical protein [Maritimibacter sp.]